MQHEIVDLNSDSDDDNIVVDNKMKTLNFNERSRLAKKSTATPPDLKYGLPTRRQAAIVSKDKTKDIAKILNSDSDKFLTNFHPESSSREKRKTDRKLTRRLPGALYDSAGIHIASGLDLCDCLQESCKGCHFPCSKCASQKCGIDCRVNRKFVYDQIEYHGYDHVIKNPVL